jgi:hypothetical protein
MEEKQKLEHCEHCETESVVFVGETIQRCIKCMKDKKQSDDFSE